MCMPRADGRGPSKHWIWTTEIRSFVRAFQGPRGQTHTHKPRKGVRGRRSLDDGVVDRSGWVVPFPF